MADELAAYQTALQQFLFPLTPAIRFSTHLIVQCVLHGLVIAVNVTHVAYETTIKLRHSGSFWLVRKSPHENGRIYYLFNSIYAWPIFSIIYASLVIWSLTWNLKNLRGAPTSSQHNYIANLAMPLLPLLLDSWLLVGTVIYTGISILESMPRPGQMRWKMPPPWLFHLFAYGIGVGGVFAAVIIGSVGNARYNRAVSAAETAYEMLTSGNIDAALLTESLTTWATMGAAAEKVTVGCQYIGETMLVLMAVFGTPACFVLITALWRAQKLRSSQQARSNMSVAQKKEKYSINAFICYAIYGTLWTVTSTCYQFLNEAWKARGTPASADTIYVILSLLPLYIHGFSSLLVGIILFTRFYNGDHSTSVMSDTQSHANTKIGGGGTMSLHPIRVEVQTYCDLEDDLDRKPDVLTGFASEKPTTRVNFPDAVSKEV